MTDDLIARLRAEAELGIEPELLREAAEALAAASRPQPEPLRNGIGGYHIKDVRGPLDVASPTQSALTTASLVKETAVSFNSTSPAAPPPWQPIETPEGLDPGIEETVRLLNQQGFTTTDSGDGVSKPAAWYASGDAMSFPHVACRVSPLTLIGEARRLFVLLRGRWTIQASYDPADESAILLASLPLPSPPASAPQQERSKESAEYQNKAGLVAHEAAEPTAPSTLVSAPCHGDCVIRQASCRADCVGKTLSASAPAPQEEQLDNGDR